METLLSYKNDPTLKEKFLEKIRWHRDQDMLIKGTYGKENGTWKGCAVACSLRSLDLINGNDTEIEYNQHARYESELGIPEWLAMLEDILFENLPDELSQSWPERFSEAIPVGVNLEPVKWHFCAFLMKENIERVLLLDIEDELKKQVVDSIRDVLALHENSISTGVWDESARSAAESAAESAECAAWSAAECAARSAAECAAWSARSAARSAAESARSAARSAESAAYTRYSEKLLDLLREAK